MATPLLEIENLEVCLPKARPLLQDISFRLSRNKILTILGPSGSGKTTLLRVIAGLQSPASGSIWINGKQVNGKNAQVPPRDRDVGFIFQTLALWPHLTVQQNIELGLKSRQRSQGIRNTTVRNILGQVHLQGYERRYPHTLSVGEQQRVALARSLVLEPALLLLDEPFSHLDWDLRQDLIQLLRSLNTTRIFVTHDQLDAISIGGELAILEQGQLLQKGDWTEIIKNPATSFVRDFLSTLNHFQHNWAF